MWLLLVFYTNDDKTRLLFYFAIKKHLTVTAFLKNFIILINEKNLRFVQNATKLFY